MELLGDGRLRDARRRWAMAAASSRIWYTGTCGHSRRANQRWWCTTDPLTPTPVRRSVTASGVLRSLLLAEDGLTLASYGREDRDDERDQGEGQQHSGDRPRDEHAGVAPGDDHRPPQVLLQQRGEDEAEQQRHGLASPADKPVSEHADDRDYV